MADHGGPAFPFSALAPGGPNIYRDNEGMTLRDYFAAKAMQALLTGMNKGDERHIAQLAYNIAQAMLEIRSRP